MVDKPLVSIITPCYNHGQYLDEAIESIQLINTPYSFEHIIINDGSTDVLTINKLTELEAKGYNVIHQRNMGLATARNNAISEACGKYILPLDADNKLHSNYLNNAVEILEKNNQIDVVYGNAVFFDAINKLECPGDFNLASILQTNYIDACALFRKSVWQIAGGYDVNMPAMGHEDWEFWINCFFKCVKFSYLNKKCFYYRVRGDSMLATITKTASCENKSYIVKKHAEKIFEYYSRKIYELEYMRNYYKKHRLKTAATLILKGKI